jgi:hypothetical protein
LIVPLARMRVRLTRKLAERIDGVDLSGRRVGDVLDLDPADARLLVAETWATPYERRVGNGPPPRFDRRVTPSVPLDASDEMRFG